MSDEFLKELTSRKNQKIIPENSFSNDYSDTDSSSIRKKIASRYKGPEGLKAQITARINQNCYFQMKEDAKKLGISLGKLISDTLEEIYPGRK